MALFSDFQDHNDTLVRKALGLTVAVADLTVAPLTTILAADGTLLSLPAGWRKLGRPSEDGLTWMRETEMSEIFGHGSASPVRSDIRRSTKRMSVTGMEARRVLSELSIGIDLSAVATTGTATSPEVTFDEPELPTYPYMRLLGIAHDTTGSGEMYVARLFHRAKVTEAGEDVWSDQDQAMVTPLTFTAFQDQTEGSGVRHFRAGPGFAEVRETEGWAAPSLPPLWTASTAYTLGTMVRLSGGAVLEVTTAGTSGTTEPVAPAAVGGTVTNGTVVFTRRS